MSKTSLRTHVPRMLAIFALHLGVIANLLCASCDSSTSSSSSAAALKSIGVSAESSVVIVGFTDQMAATAVFPDGTAADITDQVKWASSNTGVARVSNDGNSPGLVVAVAMGSVVISAQFNGITGSTQLEVRK